jgi:hypothetical protein
MAGVLWRSRQRLPLTTAARQDLLFISDFLADPANLWEILIGHVVPRSPSFESAGDASGLGGGALCHLLRWWFHIRWSPRVAAGVLLSPRHPFFIHINCLEYVILLLQIAAVICFLEAPYDLSESGFSFSFLPSAPVLLAWTDNTATKSWTNKVLSTSKRGQVLIEIYASLLRRSTLAVHCDHVAGVDNVDPDFLSRPDVSLSPVDWFAQIYQHQPLLTSYRYFRPSPELCLLIQSRLFCDGPQGLPELPRSLGQFCPIGSTITDLCMI